jgi:phosphatidylserine/phosphatidylglycerophosphate/cardiolipin synthase-like enzyme
MKYKLRILLFIISISAFQISDISAQELQVRFSPNGGCTSLIVENISKATKTIYIQAYSFTSQEIINALINAHNRNINIQVIMDDDASTAPGSKYKVLLSNNIPVKLDAKHVIAHNKIMIIDDITTITGSFNFAYNAEHRNAENIIVINDPNITKLYTNNFFKHQAHSK